MGELGGKAKEGKKISQKIAKKALKIAFVTKM